jgi:broad specificity phosphatase PhoE
MIHVYLSHPQVLIDPAVAVPGWGLSEIGRSRTRALATRAWLRGFRRIVASTETKARETAAILGDALGVGAETASDLHENDRSSTGYLPPAAFEGLAEAFFAEPATSIRGWETAVAAQRRIVKAIGDVLAARPGTATLFVGHGGVGTLLKCHCGGLPIARREDQATGGGNHFGFALRPPALAYGWQPMESPPPGACPATTNDI